MTATTARMAAEDLSEVSRKPIFAKLEPGTVRLRREPTKKIDLTDEVAERCE
jgi:hypothetical protein